MVILYRSAVAAQSASAVNVAAVRCGKAKSSWLREVGCSRVIEARGVRPLIFFGVKCRYWPIASLRGNVAIWSLSECGNVSEPRHRTNFMSTCPGSSIQTFSALDVALMHLDLIVSRRATCPEVIVAPSIQSFESVGMNFQQRKIRTSILSLLKKRSSPVD
jgi:hypothetical protein